MEAQASVVTVVEVGRRGRIWLYFEGKDRRNCRWVGCGAREGGVEDDWLQQASCLVRWHGHTQGDRPQEVTPGLLSAGCIGALAAGLRPILGARENSLQGWRAGGGGSLGFLRLQAQVLGGMTLPRWRSPHRRTRRKTLGDGETPGLERLQPLLSVGRKLALVFRSLFSWPGVGTD